MNNVFVDDFTTGTFGNAHASIYTETDAAYLRSAKSIDRIRNCSYYHLTAPLNIHIKNRAVSYNNSKFQLEILKDNEINVVFTNNVTGKTKIMLTPWIIAHRWFHILQFTTLDITHILKQFNAILLPVINAYGIEGVSDDIWGFDVADRSRSFKYRNGPNAVEQLIALYQHIGTMRSCRNDTLDTPTEFLPELFAQYLVTGKVTLNDLPEQLNIIAERGELIGYPPYKKTEYVSGELNREYDVDMSQVAEQLELVFGQLINFSIGKVLSL